MRSIIAVAATILALSGVGIVNASSPATAGNAVAGDAAAGQQKSMICAACHSADGNSVVNLYPKIAGQGAQYIAKQLHDFKGGKRLDPTMAPMAMPLSDTDINDLAAYFSSRHIQHGKAKAELVELGRAIYQGGNAETGVPACMACHGPNGSGNPAAKYPALSGQHATYVENTLHKFKKGDRTNDPAKMMRQTVKYMTDAEIKAVSSYIEGLH